MDLSGPATSARALLCAALGLFSGACSGSAEETLSQQILSLQRQLGEAAIELRQARSELEETTGTLDQARSQLAACERAAEVSNPVAMFDAAKRLADNGGDPRAAAAKMREFLELYPRHELAREASRRLSEYETRTEQEVDAVVLSGITMHQVEADIESYRGRTLDRSVYCNPIREAFALAGDRESPCRVDRDNGELRVFYTAAQERELAAVPRNATGFFRYRGRFEILDKEVTGGGVVAKLVEIR